MLLALLDFCHIIWAVSWDSISNIQGFSSKYPHLALTREGEQLATTLSKDTVLSSPIKWWKIQHKGNFFTGALLSVTQMGWVWGTESQGDAAESAAVTPHCPGQLYLTAHPQTPDTSKEEIIPIPTIRTNLHNLQWALSLQNTPCCPELKGHFSIGTDKRFSLFRGYSKLKQLGSYKNNTKQNHPQLSGSQRWCSQQQLQNFILPSLLQGKDLTPCRWPGQKKLWIILLWIHSIVKEWFSLPESPKATSQIRNYLFYSSDASVQTDTVGLSLLITM